MADIVDLLLKGPFKMINFGCSKLGCLTLISIRQNSLDQCPMPIDADQNSGMDLNADQFRSIAFNANQLIGIDRH